MKNQSQVDLVRAKLKSDGRITRNWCLQRYISRLAAIIYILKKEEKMEIEGKEFETKTGTDYMYTLIK